MSPGTPSTPDASPQAPATPAPRTSATSRRADYALLLILLLAAGLRIYGLGDQSFWLDEVLTLQNVCGKTFEHEQLPWNSLLPETPDQTHLAQARPWWSVWPSQKRDVHPPLYFLLLRLWMEAAGEGEVNVRFLSVLFSLGAIATLYGAVRMTDGPAAGLWAAALMALAGPQIVYAQEARMYALLLLLAAAILWTFRAIELLGPTLPRLAALSLLTTAMVLTHYFAVAPLVALLAYALIRLPKPAKVRITIAFVAAGVLFLIIWGPVPLTRYDNFSARSAFILSNTEGHALRTLIRVALFPVKQLTSIDPPEHPLFLLLLPLWLLPILLLRRRPELLLWYLWIAASVFFLALLDLPRGSNQLSPVRYTIVAAPALFALLASAFSRANKSVYRHALPAAATLLSLISLPTAYAHTKPDWQRLAEHLRDNAASTDTLVFVKSDDRDWYPRALHLVIGHYHHPCPQRVLLLNGRATPELESALAASPRLWIFAPSETDLSPHLPRLTDVRLLTSAPGVVAVWEGRVSQ